MWNKRTGSGLPLQLRGLLLLVTQHLGHNDNYYEGYNKRHTRHEPADDHWTQYWVWVWRREESVSHQEIKQIWVLFILCLCFCYWFTSDGYRQGLALSGNKGASTQLHPVQAVVVALIRALCVGKSKGDRWGEGRQRLAHCAVGADETQLEGASWVLLQGGAGDVKAVAFEDGTSRGLGGRVVPVLRSQELHCDHQRRMIRLIMGKNKIRLSKF